MLITKEDISNNRPFILKWSKNPGDEGAYNPGWKQQTESDRFLELIENRPSIMNDAVFHKMDALEEDISYMQVEVDLESMEVLTGDDTGAQSDQSNITDTTPAFSRSVLRARGMTARTYTTKTFLLGNIEKESFLPHIESILSERAGFSAERISIYGKRKASNRTKAGYDHIDGFLQQLYDVRTAYDALDTDVTSKTPMGVMPVFDASKPLVPQLKAMITQYTKQKGNRAKAVIYVSSTVEGTLMVEADARETDKGDDLYFQGGQLYLWGVPIVHADVLDDLLNGFNTYGTGADAVDVQDIVLMANPDSFVYGFLEEITSENDYLVEKKAYVSTVDVFFDVLLLYNKDALVGILPSSD